MCLDEYMGGIKMIFSFLSNLLVKITHYHDYFKIDSAAYSILEGKIPCIIVTTHTSFYDSIYLRYYLKKLGFKRKVYILTKQEAFKNKILSFILQRNNYIPINRDYAKNALNISYKILKEDILALSPVGTRETSYENVSIKRGAAHIACNVKVPIIPIAIIGANKIKFRHILKRAVLEVVCGKPILIENVTDKRKYEEEISTKIKNDFIDLHSAALENAIDKSLYCSNVIIECINNLITEIVGKRVNPLN